MSTVLWANALLDGRVSSDRTEAVALLEGLLAAVQERRMRFGLLRDDHDEVVRELSETLAFARAAAAQGAMFNFAVVT
jgi:hypothetical protein